MRTENQFRNESSFKYPSLEPIDLESSNSNETIPASRCDGSGNAFCDGTYSLVIYRAWILNIFMKLEMIVDVTCSYWDTCDFSVKGHPSVKVLLHTETLVKVLSKPTSVKILWKPASVKVLSQYQSLINWNEPLQKFS